MHYVIQLAVCPLISQSRKEALDNATRQLKRVKKKYGKVLTLDNSLEKLKEQIRARKKAE